MREQTYFRSHPFRTPSDAADLLGLHRLALGQVVGRVLLVFSVIGQGSLLHQEVGKCIKNDGMSQNIALAD